MREKVRYLAGVGVRQDDIALIIGCAPKTLRKRFRDELDRGVAEANATMCGYLFAAAKAGNIPAIIFWLKTRARWREEGRMPRRTDAQPPPPMPMRMRIHRRFSSCLITAVMPSSRRCCEMRNKITSPEDSEARSSRTRDLIARGSEEEQVVSAELVADIPTDAAGNRFPGEGGQSASAPGV